MKMKKVVHVLALTLLLSGALISAVDVQSAAAGGTVYIRADGSVDPPTAPVSAVDSFTYVLTDTIYGSLVVERDSIVVDGDGHRLQGTGSGDGIALSGRTAVTIKNLRISNFSNGIHLSSSSQNNISGNSITDNGHGILLEQNSARNLIRDNSLEANDVGIMLDSSSHNTICLNSLLDNHEQADSRAATNAWNDEYPFGGNYWSDYAGSDERSGPDQNALGSDGIGDTPYVIDAGNRDRYPLMDPSPVKVYEYGVSRKFPVNIVFIGFEEDTIDTGTIDANLEKDYMFRYEHYNVGYGFDVGYHFADSSYRDAVEAFVLENSAPGTTSALDLGAFQHQRATGTRMSIFNPQPGRAIDAVAVEEWFEANPFKTDLEPSYWFYVMNFTELDPADPESRHWYTVTELDFEADRLRDSWRLEWDNALNPNVGFPYACFTSQSRVFFIDPSAHQWYLEWAKTWWGLPVSGPKYEYYHADLGEFLAQHDVTTDAGRTALAYYLAGWIDDGMMNLLAPSLYTTSEVMTAQSISLQTLVLNNAAHHGYDNQTMNWIADPKLYEEAIGDLAPWWDVEVVVRFENLEDHPQLQAIFDGAVREEKDGWTCYEGMQIWQGLYGARQAHFDFSAADVVINAYVYLEKDMSMWVYGGEFTGLGGGRQILVMQEGSRYFEEDGVTPKSGLGKTFIHEAGHNFGFPHTFTSTTYAGDFAFDVMGYYPHSYFFTQYRKDTFRRLVVDFRLAALQDSLDKLSLVHGRGAPDAAVDAAFSQVHLHADEALALYQELRFLDAHDRVVEAEEALSDLEDLVLEHLIDAEPGIPDIDPRPPENTTPRRCFIATAAYNTPQAQEVQILRQFRDEYLLTNATGRAFVALYYRISPPMAEFITRHPGLKPVVRAGLLPAVALSSLAIDITPANRPS
ncbi:MAG: right-handed parallel beta-helix repeat-containing protein [Dehalococcoidia bacterium]|nr:right-handed parallel beta-helix repeat-containing protein [Dehalococcoidia bacterium]